MCLVFVIDGLLIARRLRCHHEAALKVIQADFGVFCWVVEGGLDV